MRGVYKPHIKPQLLIIHILIIVKELEKVREDTEELSIKNKIPLFKEKQEEIKEMCKSINDKPLMNFTKMKHGEIMKNYLSLCKDSQI